MALLSLAPLRHRNYALLWSGAFISNIGTWMETVSIGAYVTETTGRATWTGAVAAAGFVPIALFAPLGGALADRMSRKTLLMTTTLVQTAFAVLLTILFVIGDPSPAIVTLCVFGGGVGAALGFPAFMAMLPDLVPEEDVPGAIGLSSAQWNLGRVVGPALAGLVIHFAGFSWALGINSLSFLAVVGVLLVVTIPPPPPRDKQSIGMAIVEGARFVRRDPGLRVSVSAMSVNTFLAAPFIALVPAMAEKVFDRGAKGTSVLVTAQGVGAVTMGLMLGSITHRYGSRRVVNTMLVALPPALIAYAYAPVLAVSAVTLVFVGAFYLGALSSFTTIAQLRAPAHLRGRVLAVHNLILGSLYPLGALIQGRLADSIGLRATTAGAAVLLAVVVLGTRVVRPGITRPLDVSPAVAA